MFIKDWWLFNQIHFYHSHCQVNAIYNMVNQQSNSAQQSHALFCCIRACFRWTSEQLQSLLVSLGLDHTTMTTKKKKVNVHWKTGINPDLLNHKQEGKKKQLTSIVKQEYIHSYYMTCMFFFVTSFFKVDINYFKDHQQNEQTYHKLVIEMHDITRSSN